MKKAYVKPSVSSVGAVKVMASVSCSNGDRSHCLRS